MSNHTPSLAKAALRRSHALRGGKGCRCCMADSMRKLRRTQRRVERHALRAELAAG